MISRDHLYKNTKLTSALKKLPMEEFYVGNFSKAQSILAVCREFIANTRKSITYALTDGLGDIDQYHQQELNKLQQEYAQKLQEKEDVIKKIEDIKQEIVNEKLSLKNQGNGDKSREVFYDYIEKVSKDKNTFDNGFSLGILMSAFEKTQEKKPEKYNETKDLFEKFVASARICVDNLISINARLTIKKIERRELTSAISHEGKYFNLEKKIERIDDGSAREQMESYIEKQICEIFGQRDYVGNNILDARSVETIFTELLATNLIVHHKTNKDTKLRLIENHPNKIDLWEYLSGIYDESRASRNPIFSLNINTGRSTDQRLSVYEARDVMIDQIVSFAKDSLESISDISRLWYDPVLVDTPHQENVPFELQKIQVIESLSAHLRAKLNENNDGSLREQDPKIKKLFEVMYFEHDNYEFEGICKKIWNADALLYGNMILVELEFLMKEVYKSMNQQERDILKHNNGYVISRMVDEVKKEEKAAAGDHLSLFTVYPIYKLNGYVDEVVVHIQSSLNAFSYKQKSLLTYVVSKLICEKGFENGFDTKDPIPTFSDEEFLNLLKHTKNGRSLYEKIKKKNLSIFPDIEQRVKGKTE